MLGTDNISDFVGFWNICRDFIVEHPWSENQTSEVLQNPSSRSFEFPVFLDKAGSTHRTHLPRILRGVNDSSMMKAEVVRRTLSTA